MNSLTAQPLVPFSFPYERPDAAPTPTRFLKECGEYLLTPSMGAFAEPNPFEASFRSGTITPPPFSRSNSSAGRPSTTVKTPSASDKTTSSNKLSTDYKSATTNNDSQPTAKDEKSIVVDIKHERKDTKIKSSSLALRPRRDSKMFDDDVNEHEESDSGFSSAGNSGTPSPTTTTASTATPTTTTPPKSAVTPPVTGEKRKTPDSPADDTDETSEKRRRFLERNRRAASKCRQKKKLWMQELESRSDEISNRNKALQLLVAQLKEEVMQLRGRLLAHRNCNCNVIQRYVQTSGHFLNPAARMHPPPLHHSLPPNSFVTPHAMIVHQHPMALPQQPLVAVNAVPPVLPGSVSQPLTIAPVMTTAAMVAPVSLAE